MLIWKQQTTSLTFVQSWSRDQYLVLKSMDMYKIDYIKDF